MRQKLDLSGEWKAAAGMLEAAPASLDGIALEAPAAGAGWLLLPFSIPGDWQGAETELHIEGATRPYELWINGARAGGCAHAFVPAEFPITRLLRAGANLAAVRFEEVDTSSVQTPAWDAGIDPVAFTRPTLYGETTLAGFPALRIERLRLWPDVRRRVLEVEVETSGAGRLHLRVEGLPIHLEAEAGTTRLTLDLPRVEPWHPAQPAGYVLTVDYMAVDGTVDHVRVPFGLREVSVKEDQFHCNGRPLCVRGVWHAPLDVAPELASRLVQDVCHARLNSIRLLWPDSATLRAADEAGVLVFVQLPPALDDAAAAALMDRYHAHASLAGWWMVDREDAGAQPELLWRHDATRLLLCQQRGHGTTGYYRPRKQQCERATSFSFFASPPFEISLESYWRRIGQPGALTLVETLSAFGLEQAPDSLPEALEGIVENAGDLVAASQGLQAESVRYPVDAFRLNPQIAGLWLQGLMPFGAWPNSALHDAQGNPRTAMRILEALQRPMRPVIHMEKSSLCVREEVHVSISLLNDARIEGRGEVFLQVVGPTNQVLWKKRRQLRIPRHGKELWSGSVAASGSTGKHKFVVRLLQDEKVLGDSVFEFHVMEAPPETRPRVHVVDPRGEWEPKLRLLAQPDTLLAPVHVLPPVGPSIFAAPENELLQSLAQVKGGAGLLVFGPPADWNELADRVEGLPRVEQVPLAGTGRLHHLYTRQHPMWEGLPARTFLRQPYREVTPVVGLRGESDEAIAGWYEPGACDSAMCHAVLSARYGQGRIIFISFRLLECLGADALADRAFVNLVQHVARRVFAPRQPLPLEQRVVEWLRGQRRERMRRWMNIGEFPNQAGEGYAAVYPPEQQQDFEASYPGWRDVVRWKPWSTLAAQDHRVDLAEVFAPPAQALPRQDASVGYAYAEFTCERRLTATLTLRTPQPAKVWLNGKVILEHAEPQGTAELPKRVEAEAVVKQGRNTMLVKLAKKPGPFWFEADWSDHRGDRLSFTWWK